MRTLSTQPNQPTNLQIALHLAVIGKLSPEERAAKRKWQQARRRHEGREDEIIARRVEA